MKRTWGIPLALATVAAVAWCGGPPAYRLAARALAQRRAQALWRDTRQGRHTGVAGWLSIPAVSLESPVLRGVTAARLHRYPCALAGAGPRVIMGHRDAHFRPLGRVGEGDTIEVREPEGNTRVYTVRRREIIDSMDVPEALANAPAAEWLVLLTCYPIRFAGPAPQRLLVWGQAVD